MLTVPRIIRVNGRVMLMSAQVDGAGMILDLAGPYHLSVEGVDNIQDFGTMIVGTMNEAATHGLVEASGLDEELRVKLEAAFPAHASQDTSAD